MKKIICALIIGIVVAICTLIGVKIYKNSDLYDSNDTESRYGRDGFKVNLQLILYVRNYLRI
jgi:hypothetical protein